MVTDDCPSGLKGRQRGGVVTLQPQGSLAGRGVLVAWEQGGKGYPLFYERKKMKRTVRVLYPMKKKKEKKKEKLVLLHYRHKDLSSWFL